MSGRTYFEDLEVGQIREFGAYPVTRDEVVAFARQFDPQAFHIDETAAEQSIFGGLIASGWHTAAMMMRMVCDHQLDQDATLGAMGFDELRWLKPVRPGDVLSCRSVVREKTPSRSKPDRGTVKVESSVLNQDGEVVMTLTSLVLYQRRPRA